MTSTQEKGFTQFLILRSEYPTANERELMVIALKRQYIQFANSFNYDDLRNLMEDESPWHKKYPRAKTNAKLVELGYDPKG